jgi:hypothetical protein
MATPAAQGEVWEVVIEGRQEGQQVLNVMFFQAIDAVDDMELRLLRAMIICILTTLRPVMGNSYQLVKVSGKRITPDVGPVIEVLPLSGEATQGGSEGDTLPAHCSICINIHSVRGGRSGRGRHFVPGVPEDATQGSYILDTNPYWTAILAYVACVAEKFITGASELGSNRIALGVFSRKIGGVKAPFVATGFARATRLVPRNIIGSTNSRKVGRGS